jgi:hypothetical protein
VYLKPSIWILYGALFAIAIPWYWRPFFPTAAARVVAGLPLWVLTAIAGSLAISVLTAFLLSSPWEDEEDV